MPELEKQALERAYVALEQLEMTGLDLAVNSLQNGHTIERTVPETVGTRRDSIFYGLRLNDDQAKLLAYKLDVLGTERFTPAYLEEVKADTILGVRMISRVVIEQEETIGGIDFAFFKRSDDEMSYVYTPVTIRPDPLGDGRKGIYVHSNRVPIQNSEILMSTLADIVLVADRTDISTSKDIAYSWLRATGYTILETLDTN